MGNIFYFLLTDREPFENIGEEESESFIQELVKRGSKPQLDGNLLNNIDLSIQVLINAIKECHKFDWKDRPQASLIRDYLQDSLDKIVNNVIMQFSDSAKEANSS